jgi:hypothetical protein
MEKYINHGLNSRASLIKQTPSSQFSGNYQSSQLTWHYEIQKINSSESEFST